MKLIDTPFKDLYVVEHTKLVDMRGFFTRTYCRKEFGRIGFNNNFVQFNHSFNTKKGTIRGMHYQKAPFKEYKLIRCINGGVFDVVIDLRKKSKTFLKHFSIELTSDNLLSVLIPEGFAHGFQTLKNNTSLIYHHTNYFDSKSSAGINYNDPNIEIKWPLKPYNISEKDLNYPLLNKNFKGI